MKKIMLTAAIAAFAISAPVYARAGKSAKCVTPTTAQVESLFVDFNNAWATKNPDTVTALFAKDAVLLATISNKPRTDHAGIRDYFVGFLKPSPVGTINTSTVKTSCNMAARVGTWTVTVTDAATGTKTDLKARYSFIYKMEAGKWKIDHLHSSLMPEKVG